MDNRMIKPTPVRSVDLLRLWIHDEYSTSERCALLSVWFFMSLPPASLGIGNRYTQLNNFCKNGYQEDICIINIDYIAYRSDHIRL